MHHLVWQRPGVEHGSGSGMASVDGSRKHHSYQLVYHQKLLCIINDFGAAIDRHTTEDFEVMRVAAIGGDGENRASMGTC